MPSKIWLHKNTKYNTVDEVCGYQYEFAQGIGDEGGIENFVKYVPADAFIEKAKEFIWSHTEGSDYHVNYVLKEFEKYMKGE